MSEPGLYRNVRRLSERARRRRSGGGDDGMPVYTPGGSRDEERKPIGVPEDYTAPYVRDMTGMSPRAGEGWAAGSGGHGSIQQRRPIYNEGDQWRPASLDPAGIGRLQASLAAAGLLTDFRYGVWDDASIAAYEKLLGEANAAGITAEAAMRNRAQGIDFGGGSGGSRSGGGGGGRWEFDENGEPVFVPEEYVPPPLELKRTNRDDLIRAIRTGVIDTMGTGWNSQQVGELADLYLAREEQVQRDAYNQRISLERTAFEQGESAVAGAVIEEPTLEDPDTFLENELRRRDPVGVQAAGVVQDSMPMFLQALRGWGA